MNAGRGARMRQLKIEAYFDDAYDGIIRLLADAQRMGLRLESLNVSRDSPESCVASLLLALPDQFASGDLVARLGRHPTVRRIQTAGATEAPDSPGA